MREISRELGISRQTIYCWINAGELDRDLEEVRYCPRDTGVAGVSVSGTTLSVSGIASGTSAATVTASDPGGLSAAQTFSVDVAAPAPTTIAVMPDSATLTALDDTIRLTADVSDQLGRPIAPTVVWSSGDTSVVTVDSTGLAVAAGPGEATVTATAGAVSDSSRLTVDQAVSTVRLAPVADTLKALGDTLRMTAAGFDANGHPLEDSTFTWSSSDESVVTVDETGVVTAAGNGSATVTASSEGASDSASVTVSQRATDVHVSPKAHTLTTGETVQLAATAADKNGHMVAGAAFTWTSSDTTVVTVDETGLVHGRAHGLATVTAASGDAEPIPTPLTKAMLSPPRAHPRKSTKRRSRSFRFGADRPPRNVGHIVGRRGRDGP